MTLGLLCFALACLLTLLFVPLIIRFCKARQLFDRPGPLKIHRVPVPRLGGIAVVAAILASIFATSPFAAARAWPVFSALGLIWMASLIDDVCNLSAGVRLGAQSAAAALLWLAGWRVPFSSWPHPDLLSLLATCTFVAGFVNALNFLDGSDGLAAGVSAIVSGAYALLFALQNNSFGQLLTFATLGACLGFLGYNFPPAARIFLGDSGSAALGFLIAFFGLESWRNQSLTAPRLLFPFIIASLPVLDAALAFLRRLMNGASPLYGDRRHIYDLLLARKWSALRVAVFCYAITVLLAALAFLGVLRETPYFTILALAFVILMGACMLRLGSLRGEFSIAASEILTEPVKREGTESA